MKKIIKADKKDIYKQKICWVEQNIYYGKEEEQ